MRFRTAAIMALSLLPASACTSEPYVCTAEPRPAIIAEIRDPVSGAPLAYRALLRIRDGS
ncbi:MAG: hypothetical protein ACOY71_03080 [Gemmatimonadota bacterium]